MRARPEVLYITFMNYFIHVHIRYQGDVQRHSLNDLVSQTHFKQINTRGGCWHADHNKGLVYTRARPEVLYNYLYIYTLIYIYDITHETYSLQRNGLTRC